MKVTINYADGEEVVREKLIKFLTDLLLKELTNEEIELLLSIKDKDL